MGPLGLPCLSNDLTRYGRMGIVMVQQLSFYFIVLFVCVFVVCHARAMLQHISFCCRFLLSIFVLIHVFFDAVLG